MIGFPFDSHVEYDTDGQPIFDRAISSAPYRALLKELFKTGIMPTYARNMLVEAGENMTVIVNPGFAMVEGCMKLEEDARTLIVQEAGLNYDRIDTVVLRLNDNDDVRACDFYILEGTPSANPVRPELTRNNSIYELGLADIFIPARSISSANYRITDTRYEMSRCGIISSISEFNTEGIYQQIQADLAHFKDVEEADFDAWFEKIRGQLDEDAAGHLQNEINELQDGMVSYKKGLVPVEPLPRDADRLVGDGVEYDASDITAIKENLSNIKYFPDFTKTTSVPVTENVNNITLDKDKMLYGYAAVGGLSSDNQLKVFVNNTELAVIQHSNNIYWAATIPAILLKKGDVVRAQYTYKADNNMNVNIRLCDLR